VVPYETPRGTAASYYPETNPLVPLDSTADGSNTPTSKSVVVRLRPAEQEPGSSISGGSQDGVGSDEHHKARPEPEHLS
jgi:formate dehydrogenase major subunit